MTGKVKWIVLALALSLAINVFIAGLVIGRGARPMPPGQNQPNVGFNMKKLNKYLSPAERRKFRKAMVQQRDMLRGKYFEMKEAERRIKELITAPDIDPEELTQALQDHADFAQDLQSPVRKIVAEIILDLDHESRIQLAKDIFGSREGNRPRPRRNRGN